MKWIMVFCTMLSLLGYQGYAQASNCYDIRDADLKNECLATTTKNLSKCYSIKNSDLKNSCLANLNNKKSSCYNIKDKDQKNRCLSNFK